MRRFLSALVCAVALAVSLGVSAAEPLVVVVMDPMSAPLACDCVQGYAQRKYETLGVHLEKSLGRKVEVVWNDSLAEAMTQETKGRADLIVGKHSVVLAQATASKLKVEPIARLTAKDGSVDQWGLLVVRAGDSAQTLADLKGYRVFWGQSEAEEKSKAIAETLAEAKVPVDRSLVAYDACSEAAKALMALPADAKAVAAISSYAEPLLEGCKTIKKGDLRVVGRTKGVPFVTAFANAKLPAADQEKLTKALLDVGKDAKLLIALETKEGFVSLEDGERKDAEAAKKRAAALAEGAATDAKKK